MWGGDGVGERVGMGVEVMVWGSAVGRGLRLKSCFLVSSRFFFFCMHVSVCVPHVCCCPWRPEESIKSTGYEYLF